MRPFSMIAGHILGGVVLALGILWIVIHIAELPDYKLIAILAAMNIMVLNHLRWYRLSGHSEGTNVTAKVNQLVVSNYLILILFCGMLEFTP